MSLRHHYTLHEKEEFVKQMEEALKNGKTVPVIAKQLGININSAYKYLREARLTRKGLDPKTPIKTVKKYNEDTDIELQKLRAENRMLRQKLGDILLQNLLKKELEE